MDHLNFTMTSREFTQFNGHQRTGVSVHSLDVVWAINAGEDGRARRSARFTPAALALADPRVSAAPRPRPPPRRDPVPRLPLGASRKFRDLGDTGSSQRLYHNFHCRYAQQRWRERGTEHTIAKVKESKGLCVTATAHQHIETVTVPAAAQRTHAARAPTVYSS